MPLKRKLAKGKQKAIPSTNRESASPESSEYDPNAKEEHETPTNGGGSKARGTAKKVCARCIHTCHPKHAEGGYDCTKPEHCGETKHCGGFLRHRGGGRTSEHADDPTLHPGCSSQCKGHIHLDPDKDPCTVTLKLDGMDWYRGGRRLYLEVTKKGHAAAMQLQGIIEECPQYLLPPWVTGESQIRLDYSDDSTPAAQPPGCRHDDDDGVDAGTVTQAQDHVVRAAARAAGPSAAAGSSLAAATSLVAGPSRTAAAGSTAGPSRTTTAGPSRAAIEVISISSDSDEDGRPPPEKM